MTERMAERGSFSEADLSCPVCHHIYMDPVMLSCSHSFCKVCLAKCWQKKKSLKCPLCKKRSSKMLPPPNLHLKMLCDRFRLDKNKSDASENLCRLHEENLKLFCLEDKEPVCVVCQASKRHSNHSFRPLDEVAQEHREEVKCKLKPLQDKFNSFLKAKRTCDLNLQHIKNQTQHTEKRIKDEFEKLHQFLQDEETKQISALKKEEKEKSQMLNEKFNLINNEILKLSDTIKSILDELATKDTSFLKNYKVTLERTEYEPKDTEIESESLIDVAKHLGNLRFRVWEKMKEIVEYYPVILNPNTAHPRLNLSDDLTTFVCQDQHEQLPENPERFGHHLWVLGSEGFNSGTHCWEIEVENSVEWTLGVVTGYVGKRHFYSAGVWKSHYQNATYGASASGGSTTILKLTKDLQRIRVQLDLDHGYVSFSDSITGHNLKTFFCSFTDRVYPYFCNQCLLYPLRILPEETFVSVEQSGCSTYKLACDSTDSSA
ncbi:E3 ubiquitin-protein ligase TRIM35 isoform X1 [Pangasianodon hypophthalmus]|uniref:E3 ubiquitin-protein ligase TRIM35 isoform X1 n=1 Tax=Pangasianodon hypophthalmus TaxID=310915 RepID=UPI0023081145|nr:E3 ubiquitin-protein ligase TRIM35 isoform X1 [Pangasianodon hypophthalmus]